MKKVLLLSLVLSAVSAAAIELPSKKVCAARENLSFQILKQTRDRFNVGEVTRTDVAQTEIAYLNVQLQCASIVRDTYCASAPEQAGFVAYGMREEAKAGMRTTLDVETAELELINIKAICED